MPRASKGRTLAASLALAAAVLALGFVSNAFSAVLVQPKRPASSYMLWLSANRPQIVEAIKTKDVTAVAKEAGKRWAMLGDEGKALFEQQAQELKAAYHDNMEAFKAQGGVVTTKARRTSKPARDPNRPKKPATAYMGWLADNRASIKDSLPAGASGVTDVAKKAGEMWKEVSAEQRQPYQEAYEAAKLVYKEKIQAYEAKKKKLTEEGCDVNALLSGDVSASGCSEDQMRSLLMSR